MNNLKLHRENLGLTQVQVAQKSGMSAVQYQFYEYDKYEPGVRTAIRIAKALETTAEELYPPEE